MSEAEVRKALLAKGHPPEDTERAIEGLRQQRYLDDPSLAARFARSRLEHGGQGERRIRQTLRKKGVVGPIIEEGIRLAQGEVSEGEALERLARRYWERRQRQPPVRRLRALWAFLLRRGYPAGLVHERLRALWPAWSEALEGVEPDLKEEE
jgi:regulatory protein